MNYFGVSLSLSLSLSLSTSWGRSQCSWAPFDELSRRYSRLGVLVCCGTRPVQSNELTHANTPTHQRTNTRQKSTHQKWHSCPPPPLGVHPLYSLSPASALCLSWSARGAAIHQSPRRDCVLSPWLPTMHVRVILSFQKPTLQQHTQKW